MHDSRPKFILQDWSPHMYYSLIISEYFIELWHFNNNLFHLGYCLFILTAYCKRVQSWFSVLIGLHKLLFILHTKFLNTQEIPAGIIPAKKNSKKWVFFSFSPHNKHFNWMLCFYFRGFSWLPFGKVRHNSWTQITQ